NREGHEAADSRHPPLVTLHPRAARRELVQRDLEGDRGLAALPFPARPPSDHDLGSPAVKSDALDKMRQSGEFGVFGVWFAPQLFENGLLDGIRGNRTARACFPPMLLGRCACVVADANLVALRVGWNHRGTATGAKQQPAQRRVLRLPLPEQVAAFGRFEDGVYFPPEALIDDRFLLARMKLALQSHPSYINRIREHVFERVARQRLAAILLLFARDPGFSFPATPLDLVKCLDQRPRARERFEDLPHLLGFFFVHVKLAAPNVQIIAEHGMTAGPFSLAARRENFVAGPFPGQLPFVLGERKQ